MICGNCGTQNASGAKFCMECASPLAAGCPNCGFVNQTGAKFCSECATPLTQRAAAPAASAGSAPASAAARESVAERRVVSVLFADLVGFTPFAEERDSEDVRDTLTRYFELAREVVGRYGGTIEKFIGDAVMAVWGAPTAHEDDAERAVRAALELVDSVVSLGSGIQARAGVLTGEAAVTVGATNQGMVAGDIVNTASRLQGGAAPGTVLVGEATQRAAAAAIHFEPVGDQTLKGKQVPIAAWRAARVVAERGGRNRSESLEAPFVGRQEEMRLLKELFHATGREKRLRVVSIIGPAGIGKSRLAWEFSKYTDGVVEDIYWHSGRSPAYGEGITFWALGEMVRERCALRETDDEETTRRKVSETVHRWIADVDERGWIEGALLTLLGVESSAEPEQLFGAWRTFFERIAANGMTVLIFEDMHFADTGLLDFVDHLLEWSRGLPIYVVTLARPDLIERRPSWGAGKRNFVSMYLEPLPREQMRELLAGLVPGLPQQAVATIVARADGIPLYAVETVRTLVGEGRLVQRDGVYAPVGDLASLSVPETLAALIAARLDTLDETDRRLVHDAAVLGQSFTAAGLSAVAGVPEEELEPRLAGLVRRELLERKMDPRSPERGQYEFVQALIREVAYNTLSRKDRKKLHLAAARYFEQLGGDELAGALASHYLAAHANSTEGDEAYVLAGQARIALKAAASRASALGAFDQAVSFLEQALTVTQDPAEQADMLEQAAEAARPAAQLERAENLLRRALDLRTQVGDRAAMARATARLADAIGLQLRPGESVELLEKALTDFADLGNATAVVEMKVVLARALHFSGDETRPLAILEEVLGLLERHDNVPLLERALLVKGGTLIAIGRNREGLALTRAVRDIANEHGHTDMILRATNNLAGLVSELDPAQSLAGYRETLALARRAGHRDIVIQVSGNIGYSGFLAGEWDAAIAEMEGISVEEIEPRDSMLILNNQFIIRASRGESIASELAELERLGKGMSGSWRLFLADPDANAGLASGDYERARQSFVEIAESDPSVAPEYFYRAVRPALWAGDLDTARTTTERAIAAGGHGPLILARRQTMRAGVAALEGRSAEAVGLYREALRGWRTTHAVWDEALTGLDMALLLDPTQPEVAAAADASRAIFERLRARPYLEKLDAAVASASESRDARRVSAATRREVAVAD